MQMQLGPGVNYDSMSLSMNSLERCDLNCSLPASPNRLSLSVFFYVLNVVFILIRTAEFNSFSVLILDIICLSVFFAVLFLLVVSLL